MERLRRKFHSKGCKYRAVCLVLISSRESNSFLISGQKATIVLLSRRDKFSIFIRERKIVVHSLTIIFNYASFMWASHCFMGKTWEKHFLWFFQKKNFHRLQHFKCSFRVRKRQEEENYLWSENLWETIKRDKSELCT